MMLIYKMTLTQTEESGREVWSNRTACRLPDTTPNQNTGDKIKSYAWKHETHKPGYGMPISMLYSILCMHPIEIVLQLRFMGFGPEHHTFSKPKVILSSNIYRIGKNDLNRNLIKSKGKLTWTYSNFKVS